MSIFVVLVILVGAYGAVLAYEGLSFGGLVFPLTGRLAVAFGLAAVALALIGM